MPDADSMQGALSKDGSEVGPALLAVVMRSLEGNLSTRPPDHWIYMRGHMPVIPLMGSSSPVPLQSSSLSSLGINSLHVKSPQSPVLCITSLALSLNELSSFTSPFERTRHYFLLLSGHFCSLVSRH